MGKKDIIYKKAGVIMFNSIENIKSNLFIRTYEKKIIEISTELLKLLSCKEDNIIHININSFFVLNFNVSVEEISHDKRYLFFDKSNLPLECKIIMKEDLEYRTYFFYDVINLISDPHMSVLYQLCSNNLSPMGIFSSSDFRLIYGNELLFNMLNIKNEKKFVVGKKVQELISFIDENKLNDIWDNILLTGKPYHNKEYKILVPNEGLTYWNLSITPIHLDGETNHIVIMAEDVTKDVKGRNIILKQENLILRQQEQLEAIIENMSDCLFISDKSGKYIKLNKIARETFGDEESIKKIGDVINNMPMYDQDNKLLDIYNIPAVRALKGEDVKNVRVSVNNHGIIKYYDINATPIFDKNALVSNVVMCFRDVSYLIKQQELLIKQKDYLYDIINSLDLPILRLSYPKLEVIELNNRAKKLIHYNNYDGKIISIMDILKTVKLHENESYIKDLRDIKKTKYFKNIKINSFDGEKYYNIVCQPLIDLEGINKELIIIVVDVTDEMLQNREINNLLKAQEEFFSFISHEFKTPITVALSALQVLEFTGKDSLNEMSLKYIDKIRQSCLQQLRLVNNLLDITRADSGYLKVNEKNVNIVEVTRIIVESIEVYAKDKGIDIEFSASNKEIVTALDDEKYERIILNLLSNAVKFTPSNKKIYVCVYIERNNVCVVVRDEGIGMPKEKLGYIFERYNQIRNELVRNFEGTGIGLCLAKLMTKALGGDITVNSEVNVGTSFTVVLPLKKINEKKLHEDIDLLDDRLMRNINIEFSNLETS